MLRLILSAAVFAAATLSGAVYAERCRLRLSALTKLISDLSEMEAALRYERSEAAGMIAQLASRGGLTELWSRLDERIKNGETMREGWKSCRTGLGFDKETLERLDRLFDRFGTSDVESELLRLRHIKEQLLEEEQTKKANYPNRIKLAKTLSPLVGLALALMAL